MLVSLWRASRTHGLAVQTLSDSRDLGKAYFAFGYRSICTSYNTPSLSIQTFNPIFERAGHGIKRVLQLCSHEELDHIRQQAPKKLPRLVYGLLIARPAVLQDLPAFRANQPTRWRREAPRKPEAHVVDVSQNLLRRRPFRVRVVHCGWHVEP